MELHATLSVRVRVGDCPESFVPVAALRWGLRGEFCTVGVRCVAGGWWSAGKDSPCSGCLRLDRDIFLPARARWAEMGVFCCAGRVLYRFGLEVGVAGRVLYRLWPCMPCAGRVLYRGVCAAWLVSGGLREKIRPAGSARVANAKFFAQRAQNRPKRAIFAVLGEFFRGVCLGGGLLGVLCRGISLQLSPMHPVRNLCPLLRSARPVATRR